MLKAVLFAYDYRLVDFTACQPLLGYFIKEWIAMIRENESVHQRDTALKLNICQRKR